MADTKHDREGETMPLPRRVETEEQRALRMAATADIETRADYLPRDRWYESADVAGNYQMVRLYWNGQAFCIKTDDCQFTPWNGDMGGKRFVTIG